MFGLVKVQSPVRLALRFLGPLPWGLCNLARYGLSQRFNRQLKLAQLDQYRVLIGYIGYGFSSGSEKTSRAGTHLVVASERLPKVCRRY